MGTKIGEKEANPARTNFIQCVVVGNGCVGKTSMLISYSTFKFPDEYIPTGLDHTSLEVMVDINVCVLGLWESVGDDEYYYCTGLRPLVEQRLNRQTDIFLICFAINSIDSFEHVRTKWAKEVQLRNPGAPFILVGTKLDERSGCSEAKVVSTSQGEQLLRDLNEVQYMECSARTQEGQREVFDEAIRCVLKRREAMARTVSGCSGRRCCIS